jgi:hypothetical protein
VAAYDVIYVQTCWPLIANALDALERQSILHDAQRRVKQLLDVCISNQIETIEHLALTSAIEILGRMSALRGEEWLRQNYELRTVPRKKPPPPTDLQIRLKHAVNARKVTVEAVDRDYRATIVTTQGDVVVCRGSKMQWALDGALGMACVSTASEEVSG